MDSYPEEFVTPPVPLAALVGMAHLHGQVAQFLRSEQPSVLAFSLVDFGQIALLGGKERRPPDAKLPPPVGILKANWLVKHRQRAAAVVVVFLERERVYGDPAQWLLVCSQIDAIKIVLKGRNIKLVVLVVQSTASGESNEDRFSALRKRAEIDAKCCLTFVLGEAAELRRSLLRAGSVVVDLAAGFYREEMRRVRQRVERKAYSHPDLTTRYYFKMAVYCEFRRDWGGALQNYEAAYASLHEVQQQRTPLELQPLQTLQEVKAVAEILHFKAATLLLHSGKEVEAVRRLRRHLAHYRRVAPANLLPGGSIPGGEFLHWHWLGRQLQVFGELLQQRIAAGGGVPLVATPAPGTPPSAAAAQSTPFSGADGSPKLGGRGGTAAGGGTSVSDRELQPAYYFQLAASYMVKRRRCFEAELAALDAFGPPSGEDPLAGGSDKIAPPLYLGQPARLITRGTSVHDQRPTEAEYLRHELLSQSKVSLSQPVLDLLTRAHEQYSRNGQVTGRHMCQVAGEMGREYFHIRDYANARRLFDNVAILYRAEGWPALLAAALGYLRECARHLSLLKEYVEYSLELAALPAPASWPGGGPALGPEVGPAGPLSRQQQATVAAEVVALLSGSAAVLPAREDEPGMAAGPGRPLDLAIDGGQSPLRGVLAARAAFIRRGGRRGEEQTLALALLLRLPHPLPLRHLEVRFSDDSCTVHVSSSDMGGAVPASSGGKSIPTNADPVEDMGTGERSLMAPSDKPETRGSNPGGGDSPDLTLVPGKWTRIEIRVKPEKGGPLECQLVVLQLGPYARATCRVEDASQLPGTLPLLWAQEPTLYPPPFANARLNVAGLRVLEVEEDVPLVDISMQMPPCGMVGEILPVRISVRSLGHKVLSGEVQLRLGIQTQAGDMGAHTVPLGLVSSARQQYLSSGDHSGAAELLERRQGVASGTGDDAGEEAEPAQRKEEKGDGEEYAVLSGNLEVPLLDEHSHWSTIVYLRFNEAAVVSLTASLAYAAHERAVAGGRRMQVECLQQVQGDEPLVVTHRFAGPGRRASLLPGGSGALALGETSLLAVVLQGSARLPLRLLSLVFEEEEEDKCQVAPPLSARTVSLSHGSATKCERRRWELLGGEQGTGLAQSGLERNSAHTSLLQVTPKQTSPALPVGRLHLTWQRLEESAGDRWQNMGLREGADESSPIWDALPAVAPVTLVFELPLVAVASPPLVVETICPEHALLGVPFTLTLRVVNNTELLQEVVFSLTDAPGFVMSGSHSGATRVLPKSTYLLNLLLVPVSAGFLQLPQVQLAASRFTARLYSAPHNSRLFVYPSPPPPVLAQPQDKQITV